MNKENNFLKYIVLGFAVIIFCFLIFKMCSPVEESNDVSNTEIQYNRIVLLDLSDRILQPGQIDRDKEIISIVYDEFLKEIKNKLYFSSKDKFRIVIANQREQFPSNDIFKYQEDLYKNMESLSPKLKSKIKDSKTDFLKNVDYLYSEAKFSNNPNDYKGADIYGYLENYYEYDMTDSMNTKNVIYIITDGYQYVEGQSFNPIDKWSPVTDLSNSEVFLLEVQPKNNDAKELSRIKEAWSDWMNKMRASKFHFVPKDAMSKIKERLYTSNSQSTVREKDIRNSNAYQTKENYSREEATKEPIFSVSPDEPNLSASSDNEFTLPDIEPKSGYSSSAYSKNQNETSNIKSTSNDSPVLYKYYKDIDGDGFGDPSTFIMGSEKPSGYVSNNEDDCPDEIGPACTKGCKDSDGNCISDKNEETRTKGGEMSMTEVTPEDDTSTNEESSESKAVRIDSKNPNEKNEITSEDNMLKRSVNAAFISYKDSSSDAETEALFDNILASIAPQNGNKIVYEVNRSTGSPVPLFKDLEQYIYEGLLTKSLQVKSIIKDGNNKVTKVIFTDENL